MNDDSILGSIKKALNIPEDVDAFDQDLIMHINSVFSVLNQLGVGPDSVYQIQNGDNEWSEFMTSSEIAMVKTYMYLKIRMLFDPPSGSVSSSFEQMISEYEWRMNVADDQRLYGGDSDDSIRG